MTGEEIADKDLLSLFEAARWAPSSYNNQPWRFIYAKSGSSQWENFLNLLIPFNQSWAKNASALVVIVSKTTFDHSGKSSITHSFDTGAAWMALALEGSSRGLVVHGMQGFDYEQAKKVIQLPDGYSVEAMIAIGMPAKKESLPAELKEKESPSDRRPLKEIAVEGSFKNF